MLSYVNKEFDSRIRKFKGVIIPPKILGLVLKRVPDEGLIDIAVSKRAFFCVSVLIKCRRF